MRSKLFGRLMSFTLSATVALTSGIPALAYDGGGGDLPEEEIELLEEEVIEEDLEETGADFDALEDDIVEDEEFFAIDDEETEFESTGDVTIHFVNSDRHLNVLNPYSQDGASILVGNAYFASGPESELHDGVGDWSWDSTQSTSLKVVPTSGYVLDPTVTPTVTYRKGEGPSTINVTNSSSGYQYVVAADGSYATFSLSSAVLSLYKTEGVADSFVVAFGGATAKADTYEVNVAGVVYSVPASARTATYDSSLPIDLSTFEKSATPITGFKVYKNYGTDDVAELSSPTYFTADGKVITLTKEAINAGYAAGKSLTVVAVNQQYSISQASDQFGTVLQYNLDGSGSFITSTTDYDKDLEVTIKSRPTGNTTRVLTDATATITYADETVVEDVVLTVDEGIATLAKARLKNDEAFATSVVVTAITSEVVDKPASTAFSITGYASVLTGEDYEFNVKAASDVNIKKVGYKVGESDTVNNLMLTADNNYTIPKVTNKLTLVVETDSSIKDTIVTATGSGFAVKDRDTGSAISSSATKYAKSGEAYYFTVTPSNDSYIIKSVTYKVDGVDAGAATATAVAGVYMIPASRAEGPIAIAVESYSTVAVAVPTNTKTVIYYNNVPQEGTFYIRNDVDFTFTVKGASGDNDGTITLTGVDYTVSTGETVKKDLVDVLSYTVTIKADQLKGAVTITTRSNEIAKDDTFGVSFATTSGSAYEEDEDGKVIEPLNLLIANTDTAKLTPSLAIGGGLSSAIASEAYHSEYTTLSGTDTIVSVADTDNPVATITANKIGKETLVYKFTAKDDVNGNTVTYTGTLALEVKPHYTITLETTPERPVVIADEKILETQGTANRRDYASSGEYGDRVDIIATVTNTVTGVALSSSDGLAEDATVEWTGGNDIFWVSKGSIAHNSSISKGDLGARIAATAPSDTQGEFNIVITEGEDVYTAEEPVTLYAIEYPNYAYVTTVTVPGGDTFFKPGETAIKLDASVLNKATIKTRVYKIVDSDAADLSTADDIEDSLEEESIVDVTADIKNEVLLYDNDDDPKTVPTYLTVTGSKGNYQVNASAKGTKVNVIVSGTLHNMPFSQKIASFTVDASPAMLSVPVITNDSDTVITLKSAYLAGKTYSRGYDDYSANANNGYLFKAYKGSQFTLPTDAQWEGVPTTDTKKALVGWTIDYYGDAVDPTVAPGETIIIGDTSIVAVTAVWAYRYAFVTHSELDDPYPLFRDNGFEADEVTPKADIDIADSNYSVNSEAETGVAIGAVLMSNGAGDEPGLIYPKASTTKASGTIVWHAYDGSDTSEDDEEKLATLTVLDKTALGKGYIKGAKAGNAVVYAVYTDEFGNEYTSTRQAITVAAAPSYSLTYAPSFPTEIEVGQVINSAMVVSSSGTDITDDADGTFKWNISGAGSVEIEGDAAPVIKGAKAGTVAVSLTYTDKNGVTVTSEPKNITVSECSISINVTDKDGAVSTAVPEALANNTDVPSTLFFTVTNRTSGAYVADGTFAVARGEEDTLLDGVAYVELTNNTNIKQVKIATDEIGTGTVTLKYTSADSKVYTKDVDIKTYFTLTFDSSKAVMVAGDALGTDAANVTISGVGGVADGNNYVVKIYADNLDENGNYALDLAPYTATYSGDSVIDFAGWTGITYAATTLDKVVTKLEVKEENLGIIGIAPQFKPAAATAINVSSNSIVINNLDAADKLYKKIEVSVAPVTAAVVSATTDITLADADDGFFYLNNGDDTEGTNNIVPLPLTGGTSTDTVKKYAFTVISKANAVGNAKITLSAVGSEVTKDVSVKIFGQTKEGTKYRYVDADGKAAVDTSVTVSDVVRYYDEDGFLITNTSRTTHDAEGNLVLLKEGANADTPATLVATDGYHASADDDGNDYFIKDGVVQTGLIEVNGVQRYANTTGALVTYAMTVAQGTPGKYTDPVTGKVYDIAQIDNAAALADIFYAPKATFSEWPKNYKKGEPYPVITYTVTYTSAVQGKTIEDPTVYTAVLTSDPETLGVDTRKVTFTATTDFKGFYADKEGTKEAENQSTFNNYIFLDESGDSEEVIEISDEDSAIMIVGLDDTYDYTGKAIKPRFYVYDTADELRPLALTTDYTVIYANNKNVGTADITIKGKGNYQGKSLTAHFQIVDPRAELTAEELADLGEVKSIKISKDTHVFNGKAHYPSSILLTLVGGSAVEYTLQDEDGTYATASGDAIPAVVTVSNNVNKGTATITVRGKNNSKGKVTSKSANFTIKAAKLAAGKDGKDLEVEVANEVEWAVKGATPTIAATWNGMPLIQGEDFTAKYVYAKNKLGAASIKITGKGNFTGKVDNAATFTIKALDLDSEGVSIASTNAIAGLAVKKLKVTVLDKAGNIIPKKLYKVSVLDESGEAFTGTFEGEKTYTIVVDRKDSNVAELGEDAISAAITTGINFSKVKIKVTSKYTRFYSGSPVVYETPEEIEEFNSKIAVTLGSETLKLGEDFEITGYTNNIKKGTMTVSLSGIGKYSGTKNVKIKIAAKQLTK